MIESRPGTKAVTLLIGGSRDGEVIEDIGMPMIERIVQSPGPTAAAMYGLQQTARIERYWRHTFHTHDSIMGPAVYVVDGMTLPGALLRLIVHYKPGRKR